MFFGAKCNNLPMARLLVLVLYLKIYCAIFVECDDDDVVADYEELPENGNASEDLELGTEPCPAYNGEIVGGQATLIRRHPYQVSFVINGNTFCGGFIISPDYVMTAAHCVQRASPSRVRLRVGSTFRDAGGRIVPVVNITSHERYGRPQFDNDIAVMRLGTRLTFGPRVAAVTLPSRGQAVPDGLVTVTGWGLTMQGGRRIPRSLMMVRVPVVWQWLCRLTYGNAITDSMFCAGNFLIGGESSCQGDSGGPAVVGGVAFGIVSFARGCALPLAPTVFTNIAAQRDWVTANTGV